MVRHSEQSLPNKLDSTKKRATGGPLSFLQVKKRSEKYSSLLANGMDIFLGNGEGLPMLYESVFNLTSTYFYNT